MTDIAAGRQLRLPEDLAQLLIEDGIAIRGGTERRDSIPGIIESAAALTTAVITLAQIPVTLDHLRRITTKWLSARQAAGKHTAKYLAQHPSGTTSTFSSDGSEDEILTIICTLIYPYRPRPPVDE